MTPVGSSGAAPPSGGARRPLHPARARPWRAALPGLWATRWRPYPHSWF